MFGGEFERRLRDILRHVAVGDRNRLSGVGRGESVDAAADRSIVRRPAPRRRGPAERQSRRRRRRDRTPTAHRAREPQLATARRMEQSALRPAPHSRRCTRRRGSAARRGTRPEEIERLRPAWRRCVARLQGVADRALEVSVLSRAERRCRATTPELTCSTGHCLRKTRPVSRSIVSV